MHTGGHYTFDIGFGLISGGHLSLLKATPICAMGGVPKLVGFFHVQVEWL
jgi:hypothetical protein